MHNRKIRTQIRHSIEANGTEQAYHEGFSQIKMPGFGHRDAMEIRDAPRRQQEVYGRAHRTVNFICIVTKQTSSIDRKKFQPMTNPCREINLVMQNSCPTMFSPNRITSSLHLIARLRRQNTIFHAHKQKEKVGALLTSRGELRSGEDDGRIPEGFIVKSTFRMWG